MMGLEGEQRVTSDSRVRWLEHQHFCCEVFKCEMPMRQQGGENQKASGRMSPEPREGLPHLCLVSWSSPLAPRGPVRSHC